MKPVRLKSGREVRVIEFSRVEHNRVILEMRYMDTDADVERYSSDAMEVYDELVDRIRNGSDIMPADARGAH